MPEFEPHTRNEALLNAIRENTGGGTGSVDFEPRTRNEYLLNEIRKNTEGGGGGGGGSGLPDVTDADNGKVLGVADGSWGAVENLPVISHDQSTKFCTFTEDQATYMKSGKPFIVMGFVAMLPSEEADPTYNAIVILSDRVTVGWFTFVDNTSGYFVTRTGKVSPNKLYTVTGAPWYKSANTNEAFDALGNRINGKFFGMNLSGNPYFEYAGCSFFDPGAEVAEQVTQIVLAAQQVAEATGSAKWYAPFDTADFLYCINICMLADYVLFVHSENLNSTMYMHFVSAVAAGSSLLSATFHGEVVAISKSNEQVNSFKTYPFDITFANDAVGISMTKNELSPLPSA